jgi:pimeloyl-ACP methyl ester carboxylesterase
MENIGKTSTTKTGSNVTARTQFLETITEKYAYRRFGNGPHLPLLFLQHFTGTLDNWDPAVTDSLASGREVILFDNAGVGRSSGTVPLALFSGFSFLTTFRFTTPCMQIHCTARIIRTSTVSLDSSEMWIALPLDSNSHTTSGSK